MNQLLTYYIIDRKSGISYDPFYILGNFIVADSNVATRKGETIINVSRLAKGLSERRYRLVGKNLAL
jgi:hypothetical protein